MRELGLPCPALPLSSSALHRPFPLSGQVGLLCTDDSAVRGGACGRWSPSGRRGESGFASPRPVLAVSPRLALCSDPDTPTTRSPAAAQKPSPGPGRGGPSRRSGSRSRDSFLMLGHRGAPISSAGCTSRHPGLLGGIAGLARELPESALWVELLQREEMHVLMGRLHWNSCSRNSIYCNSCSVLELTCSWKANGGGPAPSRDGVSIILRSGCNSGVQAELPHKCLASSGSSLCALTDGFSPSIFKALPNPTPPPSIKGI